MPNPIDRYLKRQSFQPDLLGIFLNPLYFIRRALYQNVRRFAPLLHGKLLDFGCGRKPFEALFTVSEYIGVDMAATGHDHRNSKVDIYYNGRDLPFPDATFDSLFCSEVFEHVFDPELILPEVNRVLKMGAPALITVPFCWNEHEIPYDYARYTSFGIRHLLEKHGFEVTELKKSGSFIPVCFQLFALYFFEMLRKWGLAGKAVAMLLILPINIAGTILSLLLPKNDSLYFNNIILARKSR
jgi:SAM-dependent methyltransferase